MSRAPLDHAVLQAAAGWFARLHAAQNDPAANAQWRAWLSEDARHRLAWSYVESINQRFGNLDGQAEQARQVFDSVRRGQQSRRAVLGSLCVAGAAGLLGWGGWQRGWVDSPRAWFATYRTGLGEVRPLTLADGSQLWLNGGTALDVQFDENVRQLRLYRGEILIETGKDPRPLAVVTRAGRMQPLGTRFSVRDQGLTTTLSVFEGAVQATCSGSGVQTTLGAGHMLVFDAQQAGASTAAQALRQDWSRGVLVAEDMPLGQVVDVLRDYRRGHLGIDPALNSLRAVGTFPLQDTDRTLAMLERALPIRVVRTLPWWVSIEAR
ncbi:iron uptake regulator [Pseudomonas putida]|uniref:Iron uptake regulator n=1 Tax=Pseudomonas putida TaxID=303 RepID=A0AA37R9N6_PSEPU|nr:FecR domain-containing protein [Pseudomonas putida]GLO15405.1 iron uptake regulator [Pseudomonas putida]GLO33221.1 iron uptake regulator [Pseudomonas putida]HDS0966768.1 FecR domain-containing protein [Pseudomonas putida]HDS0990388.1 FecR domain-containing protein [Pseudomonas putida]